MKRFGWMVLCLGLTLAATSFGTPAWSQPPEPADEVGEEVMEAEPGPEAMAEEKGLADLGADDLGEGRRMSHRRGMHGRHGMRGGRGMHGMRGLGALQGLDLSETQRQRIGEIRDRQARRAIEMRSSIQTAALDLRKAMRAENPSVREVNLQIDRIARLRADLQKARFTAMLEARSILTDEQRDQLRERRTAPRGPRRGDSRGGSTKGTSS